MLKIKNVKQISAIVFFCVVIGFCFIVFQSNINAFADDQQNFHKGEKGDINSSTLLVSSREMPNYVTGSDSSSESSGEISNDEWIPWNNESSLPTSGLNYLDVDVELSETFGFERDVTIDLNGHSITYTGANSSVLAVNDCEVTITDRTYTQLGKITGGKDCGVYIGNSGTLNFSGGLITENVAYNGYGGGVYVDSDSELNMSGKAIISYNETYYGAGVYCSEGSVFTAKDNCKIEYNTAFSAGAGIFNYGGELTLNNLSINNNTSYDNGSNVYGGTGICNYDGEIELNNTNIDYNTGYFHGCGLCIYDGIIYMNGGSISHNILFGASGYYFCEGAGILNNGYFEMNGGDICYNSLNYNEYASPDNKYIAGVENYGTTVVHSGNISNNIGEGLDNVSATLILDGSNIVIENNYSQASVYHKANGKADLICEHYNDEDAWITIGENFKPVKPIPFIMVKYGDSTGYIYIEDDGKFTIDYGKTISETDIYKYFWYEGTLGTQVWGSADEPYAAEDEIWVVIHEHQWNVKKGEEVTGDENTIYAWCEITDHPCTHNVDNPLIATIDASDKPYTGYPVERVFVDEITNFLGWDVTQEALYSKNSTGPWTEDAPTTVGSYYCKATFYDEINSETYELLGNFNIVPRIINLDDWKFDAEPVYDGNSIMPYTSIQNLFVEDDGYVDLVYESADPVDDLVSAGDHQIVVSGLTGQKASNYTIEGAENLSFDYQILERPAKLVCRVAEKTYGEQDPVLVDVAEILPDDILTVDVDFEAIREQGEDVGVYGVSAQALDTPAANNYTFDVETGNLTINSLLVELDDSMVWLDQDEFEETGQEISPVVTVKCNDVDITDYVKMSGDTKATLPGKYKIIVEGNSNINSSDALNVLTSGIAEVDWEIVSAPIPEPVNPSTDIEQTASTMDLTYVLVFMLVFVSVLMFVINRKEYNRILL